VNPTSVTIVATYAAHGDVLGLRRSLTRWADEGPGRTIQGHDGRLPGWTVVADYEIAVDGDGDAACRQALETFADECDRTGLLGAAVIVAHIDDVTEDEPRMAGVDPELAPAPV
jgi:hypothetical protein